MYCKLCLGVTCYFVPVAQFLELLALYLDNLFKEYMNTLINAKFSINHMQCNNITHTELCIYVSLQ
jgi:hypothetical protein